MGNVREDEDSSSSWNSKLDQSLNSSNPTFTFLNSINNKKTPLNVSNKKPPARQNETLLNLIKSNSLLSMMPNTASSSSTGGNGGGGGGGNSGRRSSATSSSKPRPSKIEKQRIIKKPRISDYDFDEDENDSVRNITSSEYEKLEDDLEDLNEGAPSEATTSETDQGAGSTRNNDEDYELDSSEENDADNVYNEDTNSDDLKINPKRRPANSRHFKEDWNSGDDTNERRYCICKDVSYGDMVMCDNLRVILVQLVIVTA